MFALMVPPGISFHGRRNGKYFGFCNKFFGLCFIKGLTVWYSNFGKSTLNFFLKYAVVSYGFSIKTACLGL